MNNAFKFVLIGLLSIYVQIAIAKDGIINKTESGIRFANGGIGEEQATQIRQIANNFTLRLLFSGGNSGGWLADVSVLILDGNGQTVFTNKQAGPLLYIDLPAGDYQIIGRYDGVRQSIRTTLTGENPKKVVLHWKEVTELIENKSDPTE